MNSSANTVIESLGVYLPPDVYTSAEVVEGCKNEIRFPLERISGIKTRRMAGKEEFSVDLARKAVADCLQHSRYAPEDIDLLICCNISRYDAPDAVSFEPSTSVRLRKHFGFENALVFDITNACAGMFTGVSIVQAYLQAGVIRRGMVVSGEYITHLTQTAQNEIENYMDERLACLTLGDAGAAVILENAGSGDVGFQAMDLRTYGRYSPYCTAKVSGQGGWIMHTDSVNLTDVAIKSGAEHSLDLLEREGWPPDEFEQLIMHQTSRMTLNSATREINRLLKEKVFHDGNTVNNLEERGNTASTSHFVALADQIRQGKINSGDKVVFSITASGLTIGTALYTFDDLPDRLRQSGSAVHPSANGAAHPASSSVGIRIESVGTLPDSGEEGGDSLELLQRAANACLDRSAYDRQDIDLLIYSGVYRTGYLLEPALAALLAGKLDMNASIGEADSGKTFAFDIFNGAIGFLNACATAQQMISAGRCKTVMVVASECENNAGLEGEQLMGLRETATGVILDAHPGTGLGFSRFYFDYQLDALGAFKSHCASSGDKPRLLIEKGPDLEARFIAAIVPHVQATLKEEGLDLVEIDKVFPPQISTGFIQELAGALGLAEDRFVNAVGNGPDLYSSSIPMGFAAAFESGAVQEGDLALVIAVGAGVQVACAIYRF